MPDDALQSLVQKMIDGGESEDSIAAVIKQYGATHAPNPTLQDELANKPISESGDALPSEHPMLESAIESLKGLAHPTSLGDILALLIPSTVGAAGVPVEKAAGAISRRVGQGLTDAGEVAGKAGMTRATLAPVRVAGHTLLQYGNAEPSFMAREIEQFHGGPKLPAPASAPIRINTAPDLVDKYRRPEGTSLEQFHGGAESKPVSEPLQVNTKPDVWDRVKAASQETPEDATTNELISSYKKQMGRDPDPVTLEKLKQAAKAPTTAQSAAAPIRVGPQSAPAPSPTPAPTPRPAAPSPSGAPVAGATPQAPSVAPTPTTGVRGTEAAVTNLAPKPTEAPILRDTRSRRGLSGVPGHSANDLALMKQLLKEHPDISDQELAEALQKGRLSRSAGYAREGSGW